eukprot:TRINITY_DN90530_c0_g1_i1.p1 TRINITY_DN90530_c0_g1~~TRINITY_DN90530_c0_g1_i1.p1  ORF type:complete len:600 (+),score=108.58 TRINITY_DN90530_c0_g1_i1:105-1904(+)
MWPVSWTASEARPLMTAQDGEHSPSSGEASPAYMAGRIDAATGRASNDAPNIFSTAWQETTKFMNTTFANSEEVQEKQKEFRKIAMDRLADLQGQHPLMPPPFTMPRPTAPTWEKLQAEPTMFKFLEGISMSAGIRSKRVNRAHNVTRQMEDLMSRRCEEHMRANRNKLRRGWARQFGLQTFVGMICCVCLFYEFLFATEGGARKSTLFWHTTVTIKVFSSITFIANWLKGIAKVSDPIFIWLSTTFDRVQHSGSVHCLNIRGQIMLRVLGLLHVDEDFMSGIVERVSWQNGFLMPSKNYELVRHKSIFSENEYEKDNTVESKVCFIDRYGEYRRVAFMCQPDQRNAPARVCVKDLQERLYDPHEDPMFDQRFHLELSRSLDYLLDLSAEEVDDIVNSNPWWHKLEFLLRSEEHRISGFRTYLGERPFNSRQRFVVYYAGIPGLLLSLVSLQHIMTLMYEIAVATDKNQMFFHTVISLGFAVFINLFALFLSNPWTAYFCLCAVMRTLEVQVNKDWGIIMQPTVCEDPDQLFLNSRGGASAEYNSIDSIAEVWQVVICNASIESIAQRTWEKIVSNGYRRFMAKASHETQKYVRAAGMT